MASWRSMTKMARSGSESGSKSISQRHGSADPDQDPRIRIRIRTWYQNVMDPLHWYSEWMHHNSSWRWQGAALRKTLEEDDKSLLMFLHDVHFFCPLKLLRLLYLQVRNNGSRQVDIPNRKLTGFSARIAVFSSTHVPVTALFQGLWTLDFLEYIVYDINAPS